MRLRVLVLAVVVVLLGAAGTAAQVPSLPVDDSPILLRGTVVTMDDRYTVVTNGNVLVNDGAITALWSDGPAPIPLPPHPRIVDLGPDALIFPGLANIHDHPTYAALPMWAAPTAHRQSMAGRSTGAEPYGNRYQWSRGEQGAGLSRSETQDYYRLVRNPSFALGELGLMDDVVRWSEAKALLGGQTATQNIPQSVTAAVVRDIDKGSLPSDHVESDVRNVHESGFGTDAEGMRARQQSGQTQALFLHVAEGVRDADRPAGDTVSVRTEIDRVESLGLLNDALVVIHGAGLERADFARMRSAPAARADGTTDGRGAKLVWSPLSNMVLYGSTTNVAAALAEGVTVSLGIDWSPSGSDHLLDELKVADALLRHPDRPAGDPGLVPGFPGAPGVDARDGAVAQDRALVSMVTRNPARTIRWQDRIGSVEAGKAADLVVVRRPVGTPKVGGGWPASPYRSLIDATVADVALVMVNGEPVAGDVTVMERLKPGDHEVVAAARSTLSKAVDITSATNQSSLTQTAALLSAGMTALGGDSPPAGGGPSRAADNDWTYMRQHATGGIWANRSNDEFERDVLMRRWGSTSQGIVQLEAMSLDPLLSGDDDYFFHLLAGARNGGLTTDPTPPYGRYAMNVNAPARTPSGNPFARDVFELRYFGDVLGGEAG